MRYVLNIFTGAFDAVSSAAVAVVSFRISQAGDTRISQAGDSRIPQ